MSRSKSQSFTAIEEILRKYMPNELRERKEPRHRDEEEGDWGAEVVREAMRNMSDAKPESGVRRGKEKSR